MDKNKIVTGVKDPEIFEYFSNATESVDVAIGSDKSIEVVYVSKNGCGHTVVECINPVKAGEDEYRGIAEVVGNMASEVLEHEAGHVARYGWYGDGMHVAGKKLPLTREQLVIAETIEAFPEENLLFNLTRQVGFTTLMLNQAFHEASKGSTVCYITNSFSMLDRIVDLIRGMKVDFYTPVHGGYGEYVYEARGKSDGKVVVMTIGNDLPCLCSNPDLCIVDNADFCEGHVLEHLTGELLKEKNVRIVIGSCPNGMSDIFESYYKRLWMDGDGTFHRMVVTGPKPNDELRGLFSDREYDFEYNNAREYFKKIKPLYEKIKGE